MSAVFNISRSMLGIRQRILQTTLWATVALVSIAYIPSATLAVQLEIWSLLIVDTVGWGAILGLALAKRMPYQLRAILFLGLWAAVGIFILGLLGPVGAGTEWLLTVPPLAALLFGYRGALAGILFIVLLVLGYLATLALAQVPDPAYGALEYTLASWTGVSGTLLFLCALISLTTARLLDNLEATMIELESSRQRIAESLREREQLQDQLLHAQKLSALGTMASGIAHDFNNLLQPILMASEEARELASPDSAQQQHINSAITSAQRAADLIKRILSFSQHHDASVGSTAIAPALHEIAALLRSTMPANISIRETINASDVCILATPDMLHQIFMNLGTNGCLAMKPQGGTLEFRLDLLDASDQVLLTVSDTGTGIPPTIQHRIFEPFFTTRKTGDGTGLGLAIVHKLVTQLGGSIRVSSRPGEGAEFALKFRTVPPPPPGLASEDSSTATPTTSASLYRIMVVDDEELVRATVRMTLQREGMQVIEHASPTTALQQLEHDPDVVIDLLMTDQAMPGMTGIQLATRVRILRPALPILLVSGNLTDAERRQLAALENCVTLDKPFSRKLLLAAIDAIRRI
ncbi:MAG: ATP-binding protein [Pseudohongiella sp.]